jgi:hypothetical protein
MEPILSFVSLEADAINDARQVSDDLVRKKAKLEGICAQFVDDTWKFAGLELLYFF